MTRVDYDAYIRSPEWAAVKDRYRASKLPQTCYACGDPEGPVQFHHRSYKRLGHERLADLLPLHPACHRRVHSLARGRGGAFLWEAAKRVRRANRVEGDAWDTSGPRRRRGPSGNPRKGQVSRARLGPPRRETVTGSERSI